MLYFCRYVFLFFYYLFLFCFFFIIITIIIVTIIPNVLILISSFGFLQIKHDEKKTIKTVRVIRFKFAVGNTFSGLSFT